jgi:serine/threonine-protein kinase
MRESIRETKPFARMKLRARATSSNDAIRVSDAQIIESKRAPGAKTPERFGPYYVHECLGEGGMASVHRATRIDGEGKPVALKRLWQRLCEDKDFVESFVQEARLARLLQHENIATAYELGKANGIYYIAMELVSGPTLDAVMRQSRTAAGAIPLPIIVEILIQLCDALDHAHNLKDELGRPLRLIHRDVSPANVIISNTGVVKLIDFGIAKAARSRVQTQAGYIKGKLAYVAPEYTHGRLDHRADLFAVGVVAHEMLTGHRLFFAETEIDTIQKVRKQPIQPPSRIEKKVNRDLDDIVLTALQRDPDLRWQNAAAMGRALRGVAEEIGRVDAREVLRWVEWAFTREPWSESGVGRLLQTLEHTRMKVPEPADKREAPATLPAIPALVRKPKLKEAPADETDEDAPTFDSAPPTTPTPRVDSTQLVPRLVSRPGLWVAVLMVVGLLAALAVTGQLSAALAAI